MIPVIAYAYRSNREVTGNILQILLILLYDAEGGLHA